MNRNTEMKTELEPVEYGKTDMTASALIERAVRLPQGWMATQPRWQAVSAIFKLGMTSSVSICEAAGYLPHETGREFAKAQQAVSRRNEPEAQP